MEAWEERRDFLIGCCGKTEREAETGSWTELRALEKGYADREHAAWERARFVAHLNYLTQPVWGKGQQKEKDPRKFHPFPWDKTDERQIVPDKQPTKKDMEKLNKVFENLRK